MKNRIGIGKLFIIIFMFFLVLPLMAISIIFLSTVYETNSKKISRDIEAVTYAIASKVNTRLEVPATYMMTLADLITEKGSDADLKELVHLGIKNNTVFSAIYILDSEKRIKELAFSSFTKYAREDFIGIKLNEVKKFEDYNYYWSSPFISLVNNDYVVRVSVGMPDGYVVSDISLKFLASSLIKSSLLDMTSIYLVSDDGNVISSNFESDEYIHSSMFEHPLVKEGLKGSHLLKGYVWEGKKKIGAIYKLPITSWYLLLEQDQTEAFRFFKEILNIAVISAFLVLFFIVAVLFFLRRKLIKPIRTLTIQSEKVSRGDVIKFSEEEKAVFAELHTLYESFENMSAKIRKREASLKEKEEYIRSIFDSTTNTGIMVFSAYGEGSLTDANMGAQLMLGYKLSEMIGFDPAVFVKGGGDDIGRLMRDAVKRYSMTTGRFEMVKKNGILFPVLGTVHPLISEKGDIGHFIVVFIDITEITRVQNALENEKEHLDVTLKSIGEGVIATDKQGRVTLLNSSAESILAQKSRYLLGHSIKEVMRIYDFETGDDLAEELVASGIGSKRTFRANIISKHAGVITVTLTASGMLNSKGEILGFVYVFRDITDRIKMDQELINRKVELETVNKNLEKRITEETEKRRKNEQLLFEQAKFAAMGQMISAIAHQWRQPLNALALYTQDIEEAYEHEEVNAEYLSKFVENSMKMINHMSGTIDDFRNFFHSTNLKEEVDFVRVVCDSISLISTQLKNQNINYELTIIADGKEDVFVNSMPAPDVKYGREIKIITSELKQVVLNILQNARDAISEKRTGTLKRAGNVQITVLYDKNKVVTTIGNDGGNIPEEHLVSIFDPYYTTKPEGEGTGIGLYMSKVMVEDHMGGLLVAGNIDGGAVFTITLYYDE
jgi:PAS domain S-box-containing protein